MAKPSNTPPEKPTVASKAEKAAADKAAQEAASMSPEVLLAAEMKKGVADHLNFEETIFYRVSTGSLTMDRELGGGVVPGLFVVSGPYESGKTSFTLACMKNMLDTMPNSRGFLIKAEGRLSPEMIARSGIKFVFKAEEWTDGTCFVLETNVWEFSLNTIRTLMTKNIQNKRYFIFIDSMDSMSLRDDIAKDVGTANKVAGGPLLTKQFLQKMANSMAKRGHICALAGQVSAAIQLDPYHPSAPRSGPGGGGNAKDHWSNHIFIFLGKRTDDFILEDPSAKQDRVTNKILGHKVRITIKKSTNEKSNITVEYPVKYGRTDGTSVWREFEILDMLLGFKLLIKSGSWLKLDEVEVKKLEEAGLQDVPVQLQGLDNWRKFLEGRKDVADFWYNKFRTMVGG
jgi:RecA/RadA recombinase